MRMVRLSEIADQVRGVAYGKDDVIDRPLDGYVPVLRANNIQDDGLKLDDLVYVKSEKVSNKQLIGAGDIVIAASSGSISVVGKSAQADRDLGAGFGAFCKVVRPHEDVYDRYLGHFFRTPAYRQKMSKLAEGANINNLKNEHIDSLEIPLPPLEEQKRIAAILDQADDIRRKRQHAIDRLNQLGQAIFHEMFGDPVANSMGWDKVKFTDVVADVTGGNKKTLQSDYLPFGSYPIVDQGQQKIGGFTDEVDRVCKADLPVIVFGDHTKCFKYIEFPFCLGADGTKILKSKGQMDDLYLFYAIQKIHIPEAGYSRHFKYLKEGEILVPSLKIQRQFSDFIREIEQRTEKMVSAKCASETLFASLQHRAFTGQL